MKIHYLFFYFLLVFTACKKKKIDAPKQETTPVEQLKTTVKETDAKPTVSLVFMVQIAALKNTNKQLEGIKSIEIYRENGLIKYRLGRFKTYQEATNFKQTLLNKYPDAFVQALQNDKPIHIIEAFKVFKTIN